MEVAHEVAFVTEFSYLFSLFLPQRKLRSFYQLYEASTYLTDLLK